MIPKELLAALRTIEIHTARLANEQLVGDVQLELQGPGSRVPRGASVPAGRRRARDRLERVGAHERDLREGLRRRARDDGDARRRSLAERALRDAARSEDARRVARSPRSSRSARSETTIASGSILSTSKVERIVPPKKGEKHVMRVVREILGFDSSRVRPQARSSKATPQLGAATDLKGALEALASVSRRRSVAFVISDFFAQGYERALALAAAKHDVIPVVLVDPRDHRAAGRRARDLRGSRERRERARRHVGSARARVHHARAMAQLARSRQQLFHKLGLDSVEIQTGGSFVRPLRDLFARRARRIHR